jgi:hypothetical protein
LNADYADDADYAENKYRTCVVRGFGNRRHESHTGFVFGVIGVIGVIGVPIRQP